MRLTQPQQSTCDRLVGLGWAEYERNQRLGIVIMILGDEFRTIRRTGESALGRPDL
jgi:hypothetical protein